MAAPTSRPTSNIAWGSAATRTEPVAQRALGWEGEGATQHASAAFNWHAYELDQHLTWVEDLTDDLDTIITDRWA
jgi:hypothetical protein